MSPLDVILQSAPSYQVAGRFGLSVAGLLRPLESPASAGAVGVLALAALSPSTDIDSLFQPGTRSEVARSVLADHILVLQPRGQFLSTDDLSLTGASQHDGRWSIDLMVTRHLSEDGEPAPRTLMVLMHVDVGDLTLRELAVTYHGRQRDFRGSETALPAPLAPAQVITITA